MTSPSPLDRLAGPGNVLAKEPPDAKEFAGLVRSGLARLKDAQNEANSLDSRFDLAYSAAHALCLAALGTTDSGHRSGMSFFRCCRTLSAWARKSGAFCQSVTTCGIGPSMKASSTWTRVFRNRRQTDFACDLEAGAEQIRDQPGTVGD